MQAEVTNLELLRRELYQVREERDLCRALLLADGAAARHLRREIGVAVQRLPALLRQTARDQVAFKSKLQRLADEMQRLSALATELPLPALSAQIEAAHSSLRSLHGSPTPTGDELLPVILIIDTILTTLRMAGPVLTAEPAAELGSIGDAVSVAESGGLGRLEQALQQLTAQLAEQFQKRIRLTTSGLDTIPVDWYSTLFDVATQLLRNAAEYGIESPQQRVNVDKPECGNLELKFVSSVKGFDFSFRDDGQGLDADSILDAGARCGFLENGSVHRDARRAAKLIFMPGVTTAAAAESRGNGMQIVREQIKRLGGKIQISSKKGRFTCVRATLPALPKSSAVAKGTHA